MLAVTTRTGMPMRVDDALLDPEVPTLFEGELPAAVRFQEANLRIEELSGPSAFGGRPYRDERGEMVGGETPAEEVSTTIDAKVVEGLTDRIATLTSAKEAAETSVSRLTGERDKALTDLQEAQGLLASKDREIATLTSAKEEAETEASESSAPDKTLTEAIDAVLSGSATALGRLPNEALAKLCAVKGISPIPETNDALVAALKPA